MKLVIFSSASSPRSPQNAFFPYYEGPSTKPVLKSGKGILKLFNKNLTFRFLDSIGGSQTILHSVTTNIPGTTFWCICDWAFKHTVDTNLRFRWVMRTAAENVTFLRRHTSKMTAPILWIQNQTPTDIQPLSPRPFSKVKRKLPQFASITLRLTTVPPVQVDYSKLSAQQ